MHRRVAASCAGTGRRLHDVKPPSVRFCSLLRDAHMTDCEGTLQTFLDRPQHSNLQWLIDMVPHGQSLSDRDLIGAVLAADCGAMSEGIG